MSKTLGNTAEGADTQAGHGTVDLGRHTPPASDNTALGNRLSEIDSIRANSVRFLDSKDFPEEYKVINDLADYLKDQTVRYANAVSESESDFTEVGSYFINDYFPKSILPVLANERIDNAVKTSARQLADMSDAKTEAFLQVGVNHERQSAVKMANDLSQRLLRKLDTQGQERRFSIARKLVKRVSDQIDAIEKSICIPGKQKYNQMLIRAFPRRSANKLLQCEGEALEIASGLLVASDYLAVMLGEGSTGEDYQENLREFRYDIKLLHFLQVDIRGENVADCEETTTEGEVLPVETLCESGKVKQKLARQVRLARCYNKVARYNSKVVTVYRELFFGDEDASIQKMNEFFKDYQEVPFDVGVREIIKDGIKEVCAKEGWTLFMDGVECSLTLGGRAVGRRFYVREKKAVPENILWQDTMLPLCYVK